MKSNTASSEASGSATTRPEYPNTNEPEENNLKNNFLKMIETLKEDIKNSIKEVEEKTNKN